MTTENPATTGPEAPPREVLSPSEPPDGVARETDPAPISEPEPLKPIRAATEVSISAATHLGPRDAAAVAALRALADMFDYLVENDGLSPAGKLDNVTPSKFIEACNVLGLTPVGRGEKVAEMAGPSKGSRLAQLKAGVKPDLKVVDGSAS